MAGFSDAVLGRHMPGYRMSSRTPVLVRNNLSYQSTGASANQRASGTRVDSRPDPKAVLIELQRLKAQNERLRQELEERERSLRARENQTTIDSPAEASEPATPHQEISGVLLEPILDLGNVGTLQQLSTWY